MTMVSQQPSRKQLHQSQQSEEQAPSSKQPRFHDPEKRDINQLFNNLDPSKVEEKAKTLSPIVSETWINYVSHYLVWKRVPSDYNYLDLYKEFVNKLNNSSTEHRTG